MQTMQKSRRPRVPIAEFSGNSTLAAPGLRRARYRRWTRTDGKEGSHGRFPTRARSSASTRGFAACAATLSDGTKTVAPSAMQERAYACARSRGVGHASKQAIEIARRDCLEQTPSRSTRVVDSELDDSRSRNEAEVPSDRDHEFPPFAFVEEPRMRAMRSSMGVPSRDTMRPTSRK